MRRWMKKLLRESRFCSVLFAGSAAGRRLLGHQRRLHASGGGRLVGAGAEEPGGGSEGPVHGPEPPGWVGAPAAGPAGTELNGGPVDPEGDPQGRREAEWGPGPLPALHRGTGAEMRWDGTLNLAEATKVLVSFSIRDFFYFKF